MKTNSLMTIMILLWRVCVTDLLKYLKIASKIVESWPEWKQNGSDVTKFHQEGEKPMTNKLYLIYFVESRYDDHFLGWHRIRTDVAVVSDLKELEHFKMLYPSNKLEVTEVNYFSSDENV